MNNLTEIGKAKAPDTNCLNKAEHQAMMDWMEEKGSPQPVQVYVSHLIDGDANDIRTAIKLAQKNCPTLSSQLV